MGDEYTLGTDRSVIPSRGGTSGPQVSILIPVYNDPVGIEATLTSLCEQRYPRPDYEIIVADNGSTDNTRSVVRRFATEHGRISLVIEDDVPGAYAARNAGIRAADGEILAFLDCDMTVPEDWLERAIDEFQTTNADYMGCNVELVLPKNPSLPARYDAHTGFPIERYIERQRFAPTCCLFVRRAVFGAVGLFDSRVVSGGDKEFGNRVAEAGYRLQFAEDVTMYHPARESVRALANKDLRVGRGHCQLQRYYPERYGRPGVPPRPSGVKSPPDRKNGLSFGNRIAFPSLSIVLTGMRAVGYANELVAPTHNGATVTGRAPPKLTD